MKQDAAKRPDGPVGPGNLPVEEAPFGLADEDAAAFAEEAAQAAARAALEEESRIAGGDPATTELALDESPGAGGDQAVEELEAEATDPAGAAEEPAEFDASAGAVETEASGAGPTEEPAGFDAGAGAVDPEGSVPGPTEEPLEFDAEAGGEDPEAAALALASSDDRPTAEEELAARDELPTPEEEALAQAAPAPTGAEGESLDGVTPAEINEVVEDAGPSFDKLAAKAAKLSAEQARNLIHAVLFVSDKPLAVDQLRQVTGLDARKVGKALDRLAGELREGVSGVILSEVAGGWQLRTAPESAEWIRRFLQVKPRRLTRAALETLAIVAYRQPVTRPEVEEIRGVDCGAVLKALIDWKLVKILGRKDEIGRPILYGTTREFLEFFQLKDLASLPTLREFHELSEESRQIVEEELGADAVAGIDGTVDQLADPAYLEAERERVAASEAALADLEKAMAEAETKAGALAAAIAPPKTPPEGEAPPDAN